MKEIKIIWWEVKLNKQWAINITIEDYKKYWWTPIVSDFEKWYKECRGLQLGFCKDLWAYDNYAPSNTDRYYIYTFDEWINWYYSYKNKTWVSLIQGTNTDAIIVDTNTNTSTVPKKPLSSKKTKAVILEEFEKSILVFKEQEVKIKELQEKISFYEKINIEEEKKKAIEAYKKELMETSKPIRKTKRHKSWDDIIIEEIDYKKLQLSWEKKMPLLLKWPAWCWKSSIIKALVEEKDKALVQYNFNWDTTVENLLWHKILINGNMAWEDWPLTDAVRNWKVFLADEINASSPEVQFILNGLLENRKWELGSLSVQWNNWEVIKAHPDFRFYGTYNPNYLGTNHFSTSIMSRFIGIEIKPLDSKEEKSLLNKFFPLLAVQVDILVDKANNLRKSKDFSYDLSTRDLVQTLFFIEWGFSLIEAVKATIVNSLQIKLDEDLCLKEFV